MTHSQRASEEELTYIIASLENMCTLKQQILALNVGASAVSVFVATPAEKGHYHLYVWRNGGPGSFITLSSVLVKWSSLLMKKQNLLKDG